MLVTDAAVRAHLRIDAGEDVSLYVSAAEEAASQYLNRAIYEDVTSQGTDAAGIVVNDAIRAAILLTVGHLYANRESVVTGTISTELTMTTRYLLGPYRILMGV